MNNKKINFLIVIWLKSFTVVPWAAKMIESNYFLTDFEVDNYIGGERSVPFHLSKILGISQTKHDLPR